MSYRIEMGVLAEETDEQNWTFRMSFDGSYHTLWIEEQTEAWRFSFDFHDKTAEMVLTEIEKIVAHLRHFVESDVGGPTPEVVLRSVEEGET